MSTTHSGGRGNNVNLKWQLSPIQREYFESGAKYRTLVGGRRFGKNIVGLASQIDYALNPAEYDWGQDDASSVVTWWVGPTYNQAKKYGFETAKEMLPDALIDGSPKNTVPFEIPLYNGATMEFYSYDRPKSLDGAGVDDITIDERGYMPDSIWEDNLAAMLLDTNGRANWIGKPWPESSLFEEWYEKGRQEEYPKYASWRAESYDNPFIPDARIDELFGDFPERVYNREILARFEAGGSIYHRDMFSFVWPDDLPPRDLQYAAAVDVGVEADERKARENDTDYWSITLGGVDPLNEKLYVVDTHRKRGLTLREGVGWIRGCLPERGLKVYVEANQAQEWLSQELNNQGVNAHPISHSESKEDRLVNLTIPIENDTVEFVHQPPKKDTQAYQEWREHYERRGYGPRWEELVQEALAFPNGDHDDSVDSLELLVDSVGLGAETGMIGGDLYNRGGDA